MHINVYLYQCISVYINVYQCLLINVYPCISMYINVYINVSNRIILTPTTGAWKLQLLDYHFLHITQHLRDFFGYRPVRGCSDIRCHTTIHTNGITPAFAWAMMHTDWQRSFQSGSSSAQVSGFNGPWWRTRIAFGHDEQKEQEVLHRIYVRDCLDLFTGNMKPWCHPSLVYFPLEGIPWPNAAKQCQASFRRPSRWGNTLEAAWMSEVGCSPGTSWMEEWWPTWGSGAAMLHASLGASPLKNPWSENHFWGSCWVMVRYQ